jgi:hypothetical protein
MAWLWYNHISAAGGTSVTFTNAEKQARYRERILVSMARRSASGSISTPAPTLKWTRLAHHGGYTITALVKELVERAERWVTPRLPSRAFKPYYDAEGLGYGITMSTPPEPCPSVILTNAQRHARLP